MPKAILAIASVLLIGCQTPRVIEFEAINLGTQKPDVLETVGNPTVTQRKSGQDRWVYRLYDKDILVEKWIIFQDGYVIYKGDPVAPFITAEEQDAINEKQTLQMQNLRSPSSYRRRPVANPVGVAN